MLKGVQPKQFRYIPIDEETISLLLEARDNAQTSTAEENITEERRKYRQRLYERLKAYCDKYQIKYEYKAKEL